MTVVRGRTPAACWKAFEDGVWDYWGRLGSCGRDRLVAPGPSLRFDDGEGEITLGGHFARRHVAMATSDEVRHLFDAAHATGVRIGAPPLALVLGYQRVLAEQSDGCYVLRTIEYKYTLALSFTDTLADDGRGWAALRLESDSRSDRQSWLLNHPVHHHQLGGCDDLRLPAPRGRSLLSFVDAALRAFAVNVWAEMYPNLFLNLSLDEGVFRRVSGSGRVDDAALNTLKTLLREGRAEPADWYLELERWRDDVDDQSRVAPELYDVLLDPTTDAA